VEGAASVFWAAAAPHHRDGVRATASAGDSTHSEVMQEAGCRDDAVMACAACCPERSSDRCRAATGSGLDCVAGIARMSALAVATRTVVPLDALAFERPD
jgi:hypothetical protein